jgi:hypothetical protein
MRKHAMAEYGESEGQSMKAVEVATSQAGGWSKIAISLNDQRSKRVIAGSQQLSEFFFMRLLQLASGFRRHASPCRPISISGRVGRMRWIAGYGNCLTKGLLRRVRKLVGMYNAPTLRK